MLSCICLPDTKALCSMEINSGCGIFGIRVISVLFKAGGSTPVLKKFCTEIYPVTTMRKGRFTPSGKNCRERLKFSIQGCKLEMGRVPSFCNDLSTLLMLDPKSFKNEGLITLLFGTISE